MVYKIDVPGHLQVAPSWVLIAVLQHPPWNQRAGRKLQYTIPMTAGAKGRSRTNRMVCNRTWVAKIMKIAGAGIHHVSELDPLPFTSNYSHHLKKITRTSIDAAVQFLRCNGNSNQRWGCLGLEVWRDRHVSPELHWCRIRVRLARPLRLQKMFITRIE